MRKIGKYKGRDKLIKQWKEDKKLKENNSMEEYLRKTETGISGVKLDFIKNPEKYVKKPENMNIEP